MQLLWNAVRLPVLAVLVVLAPVVRFVLRLLALLGILTCFLFWWVAPAHIRLWPMVIVSVGFGLLLVAYDAALAVLTRKIGSL